MKGRRGFNGGVPPTDLLVCFPSRANLTLMHKPICSPSRPHHHASRPTTTTSRGQGSPLFRTNKPNKNQMGSEIGSEPTSPKVTCSGQIKVRPKIRTTPRPGAKTNWLESSVGLKKDVMNFLGALRSLRFNMHCFGSVDCPSGEEDEDEEEGGGAHSRTVFSKWFMVLEENQEQGDDFIKEELEEEEEEEEEDEEEGGGSDSSVPPKNALLLMRCRSAPAKGWLEGEGEVVVRKEEEEKKGDEERLMLMSYAPDFFKVSTEIAKETWVVGSVDPLARSRSWKR